MCQHWSLIETVGIPPKSYHSIGLDIIVAYVTFTFGFEEGIAVY